MSENKPDLMTELAEVVRLSDAATPGEWTVPHLCRDDVTCNCPYVFAEGQRSQGSICDLVFDVNLDHGESLEDAKANGKLIAAAVNFLRTHHAELEAVVRDAKRWREHVAMRGHRHSHFCKECSHPYTPKEGESEDCPICEYDGGTHMHNSAREG